MMRLFALAAFTMVLFAANSLFCRLALVQTSMDGQSFAVLRVVSAALMLYALTGRRRRAAGRLGGSNRAALALFGYIFGFALAYVGLTAATGTLILVSAILLGTIGFGLLAGERVSARQYAGVAVTMGGLLLLLAPSISRPPLLGAALMACAGFSWVAYTVLGKKSADPALDTTGNFIRCLPLAALLLPFVREISFEGAVYAAASGTLASGLGYVLWYRLLTVLSTLTAALLQLSTPVITALGAWVWLGEEVSVRLFVSGAIILSGIAFVHLSNGKGQERQGLPER